MIIAHHPRIADTAASSQYVTPYARCPRQHALHSDGQILKALCRLNLFPSRGGYFLVVTSI